MKRVFLLFVFFTLLLYCISDAPAPVQQNQNSGSTASVGMSVDPM